MAVFGIAFASLVLPAGAAPVTTITAEAAPRTVTVGSPVLVTGTVSLPTATPRVVVQRLVGGSWSDRQAGSVDQETGRFGIAIAPGQLDTYTLRVRSNGGSVVSEPFEVQVERRPTSITAAVGPRTVKVGEAITVRGTVVEPDAVREVVVQRRVSGRWSDRGTAPVDQRTGRFEITLRPSQAATYELRVRTPGGTRASPSMFVIVTRRPLQVITYVVTSRGRIASDLDAFAAHAASTLADGRGWTMGGSIEFRRVSAGGDFSLVLAEAGQVAAYGPPCDAGWSCRSGRNVIINDTRWRGGAPGWGLSLDSYRHYVVNHEVGHWLGQGHASCPSRGAAAPVMMQQSKATAPCANNVWPLGWERSAVAHRRRVPIW